MIVDNILAVIVMLFVRTPGQVKMTLCCVVQLAALLVSGRIISGDARPLT